MNALDIELEAGDAVICGPFLFDQLQPLVVDSTGFQVRRRKSGAATKIVIPGEARLGEDSVYRATAPAAIWSKRVINQRLRTVITAGRGRQGLPRRNIANGWLRSGHGEWEG